MTYSFWKPTLKNILLVSLLLLALHFSLLWPHRPFQTIQWRLQDFLTESAYRIRPLPDKLNEVVIVLVDRDFSAHPGKPQTRERSLFARLIDTIESHHPRAVGLEIFFVGESQRKEDDRLAASLKKSKNVLLASYYGARQATKPHPRFLEVSLGHGFVNKPRDPDSLLRNSRPLLFGFLGDVADYGFEVKLLAASLGVPFENILFDKIHSRILFLSEQGGFLVPEIPVRKDGTTPLFYLAKKSDFSTLLASKVLRKEFPPDALQGKIVLVGHEGSLVNDFHQTPFGVMDGVYVVANNLLMFLSQTHLTEMGHLFNSFLFVLVVLLTSLLSYQFYGVREFFALLTELVGVSAVSFFFFLGGFIWNLTNGIFLILATSLAISFHKYICVAVENARLKKEAVLDENTGLYRYHYYELRLRQELWRAKRYNKPLSLMVIDIDHYKGYKDTLGKEKAGFLLKEVAAAIQKELRKTDMGATYGGDEFFVISPHTKTDAATVLAERIRKRIETSEFFREEGSLRLTVSIGLCSYPQMPIRSGREFMATADEALYHAKSAGRNRIAVSKTRKGKKREI